MADDGWTVIKGGGRAAPAGKPVVPPVLRKSGSAAGDAVFNVDVIVCIDLEATCDEDSGDYKSVIPRDQQEIVEFPFVAIDVATGSILATVQQYIRPENTPITTFCTNLTGITSATLAGGVTLAAAVARVEAYAAELTAAGKTFAICTHGTWDLPVQLRKEAATKGIPLAPWWMCFYDLRTVYRWWLRVAKGDSKRATSTSLTVICRSLGMEVHGQLHSGVDDSTTIARCMVAMIDPVKQAEAGSRESLAEPFPAPMDWAGELAAYRQAGGVSFKVEGMAYTVTRQDIVAWLRSFNGMVVATAGEGDGGAASGGSIVSVDRAMFPDHLHATGSAFVTLSDPALAAAVAEAPARLVGERPVFVRVIMPLDQEQHYHDHDQQPTLPFPPSREEFVGGGGTTVWVNNLYWHVPPAVLQSWCLEVGGEQAISVRVSTRSLFDHRLTGTAIVEYATPSAAEAALREGSNVAMAGRMPTVRPVAADELTFAESVSTWREISTATVLKLRNLDPRAQTSDLIAYFGQFGAGVRSSIHYRTIGKPAVGNGTGSVTFATAPDALQVLAFFQQQGEGELPPLMSTVPTVVPSVEVIPLHKEEEVKGVQLFVGGLRDSTTSDILMVEVGEYGHVLKASVKFDQEGRSRRFGFVTVAPKAFAAALIKGWSLTVDGKQVEFKPSEK